jgi:hypothetical protein
MESIIGLFKTECIATTCLSRRLQDPTELATSSSAGHLRRARCQRQEPGRLDRWLVAILVAAVLGVIAFTLSGPQQHQAALSQQPGYAGKAASAHPAAPNPRS